MNKDTRLSDVLHVLLHMAQVKECLTSEVLARSMGTNPAVFRRTMAGLRRAGHVISGKGHGGGWQLARPLEEITLLAVYEALERPTLFAIGSRGRHPECRIEEGVNSALAETMRQAESLLLQRFGQVTLDQLMPSQAKGSTQTCRSALPATPRGD
ncbi:Rrf2 family transcriptional regulator [Peteryoungia ipomoeae]|uniref:Rrf2 family transcriptional regulator n=1 Tax=Peteryoungia ipomoeae TaxID=1210932 RepID=A0A4S8NX59_9HYPH|nr:Rrf2 family transcriptional regulator [Peteryoungia ipomoeae]THV20862.1 Rrf2 family transcriptional regulator [Peteryoungia ipomoeae]